MRSGDILPTLADHLGQPLLAFNEDDACALRLQDDLELDIQRIEPCEELRLALPLGQPAPHARDATLVEALLANSILACGTSRHLAWEAEPERLMLCQTLWFEPLTPAGLTDAVDEFVQECRAMRSELQRAGMLASQV